MPIRPLLPLLLALATVPASAEGPPTVAMVTGTWSGKESKLPQLVEHVAAALAATNKVVVAGTPKSRAAHAQLRGGDPCIVDEACKSARDTLQACIVQPDGCPDARLAFHAYRAAILRVTDQKAPVDALSACLGNAECKAAMADESRAAYRVRVNAGRIGEFVAVTGSLDSADRGKVLGRKSTRYQVGKNQLQAAATEVAEGLVEALP